MNERVNIASGLFDSGMNCAQSVLGAFCDDYGVTQDTAFKMACGFGSGVRSAEICGAVTGAVLVTGLKYGQSKETCNSKTEEFIKRFRDENGNIVCREILDCDITTPTGKEKAVKENLFNTTCVDMVKSAVRILEELGY